MTLASLKTRLDRALVIFKAPRVRIEMYGGADAKRIYRAFRARHPRLRVVRSKQWGVALVRLRDNFDDYLAAGSSETRLKRRKAMKQGFHYAVVPSADHFDDLMDIHRSAPTRQGRPLSWYYLDPDEMHRILAGRKELHAVLDGAGRVRAYAWAPVVGDVVVIETLMGHADDLKAGTMYLLITEIVRAATEAKLAGGAPAWVMYDTFWGAGPGLASFKARLGFEPYTVDWAWRRSDAPPTH